MKVLYDYQAFGESYTTGVSRCFVELIKQLPPEVKYEILLKENSNLYIKESGIAKCAIDTKINQSGFLKDISFISSKWRGRLYRKAGLFYPFIKTAESVNMRYAIDMLCHSEYDIFHPTLIFNDYFLKYLHGKPWVMTIHDLVTERYCDKNNFQTVARKKLINKADAIVAISENTKNDIVEILNIPADRIVVIPHGTQKAIDPGQNRLIESPYFLYVGMRDGYKNFSQTLSDFAIFSLNHPDVKFVCTWKDFNHEEISLIKKLNLQDKIVHIYASELELANLYKNAIAFIYPSIYEGFGLPILEAYSYGCMCLLNNKSCFPEVGGRGALYFDSMYGNSNLPILMDKVIKISQKEKQELLLGQKERMEFYTWQKAAEKMTSLYKSLIR